MSQSAARAARRSTKKDPDPPIEVVPVEPAPQTPEQVPDGVWVVVQYNPDGNSQIAQIGTTGTTRPSEVLTFLEKAVEMHRENLGLPNRKT